IPAEVFGVTVDAVHFGAGLLDGLAVEAVEADPEAGERVLAGAVGSGLDPVCRDLLVGLVVGRVPGPVLRPYGVDGPATNGHRRRAVHGGPDQVDGGPGWVAGRGRGGGRGERAAGEGQPSKGDAPSAEHSGSFVSGCSHGGIVRPSCFCRAWGSARPYDR